MNEHRRLKKMRYGLCPTGCDWIEDYEMTKHNCLIRVKKNLIEPLYRFKSYNHFLNKKQK